ncbi:MAG: hypothetical protein ABL973_03825 [Micropepsaceae bacterium]
MLSTTMTLFAVAFLSISLATAVAPTSQRVGPGIGVGFKSCAKYTSHVRSVGTAREQDKEWVNGFVTGYNVFATKPEPKSLFMSYDADAIIRWIDEKCSSHPQSLLVDEVGKFVDGLMRHRDARGKRP